MKTTGLLVMVTLATQLTPVFAQDDATATISPPDISKWVCKFCEAEQGWHGDVTFGLGNVSDDSYKFGEYTGLNEAGGFLIADGYLYYRGEEARYVDLEISDFGLDSRSLSIEGGTQGSYDLFLHYNEIPHFTSDSASTPYQGVGSDDLTLPGWVPAATTGSMAGLPASLQNVDLETQRKRLTAGARFITESPWEYSFKVRQDTKEGSKHASGSFFFNSAQLIEPVDYVTDEIDASVSYSTKKLQANLAYYASTFSNNNQSLTWDNAYNPFAGADEGKLALPPDNDFQQLILSAGYDLGNRSRISGDIAIGHMKQDEALLAATQNNSSFPALAVPSGNSADAEVDTTNAKLKYMAMPTDRLRLNATYSYSDRDNKTPQRAYDWVTTDSFLALQQTNLPYSYTQNLLKLKADYRYGKTTRFGVGYDLDRKERTFQEIDKTDENTLWGNLRVRNMNNTHLEFKLAYSQRDGSTSQAVPGIDPPQNILLSKYNMADRIRSAAGIRLSMMPRPEYSVGLSLDFAEDDYDKSVLGLIDSRDTSLTGDLTVMLSELTSINFLLGQDKIKSNQSGSQTFAAADWFARNDDTFNNMVFGITHVLIVDRLDIGADYTLAHSTGEVTVTSGAPDPAFPDLSTELNSFRLYANYYLNENLHLRAAYWHESYDSDDWALDGVSATTVPNLLSLGELSPDYSNDVIKLSMSYKF